MKLIKKFISTIFCYYDYYYCFKYIDLCIYKIVFYFVTSNVKPLSVGVITGDPEKYLIYMNLLKNFQHIRKNIKYEVNIKTPNGLF